MKIGMFRPMRAFTLIEMLIVVVVLVVLISFFSPVIKEALKSAKKGATTAQLTAIGQACEAYYLTFEAYPGYWTNSQIAGAPPAPTTVWRQFTGTENLVVSLMGYMTFGSSSPVETVRGVQGLPNITKVDARRIGEGPVVELPGNKGVKKYGAFYSPKSTELMTIGGTMDSKDLTDDNNIPELIDNSSGVPILYLRSGGSRAQMADATTGESGMFALRHIKDYTAATSLRAADGTVYNQFELGSIFSAQSPTNNEANNLAWLVINPTMSETTGAAGTNNANGSANDSKGDVPKGQFLLLAPGPDGIYFCGRELRMDANVNIAAVNMRAANINAAGKVNNFDDVVYAGGGAK